MEPVGLGVKVQQPFETIGGVLNIANTAQQMQRSNIGLQTEDMVLRERKAVGEYIANPKNYTNERGELDFPKLQSSILSIAPTTGSEYIKHVTEAQRAGTEARRSLNAATKEELGAVGTLAMSLTGKPAGEAASILHGYAEQNPNFRPAVDSMIKYYIGPNAGNQKALDAAYLGIGRSVMPASEQARALEGNYVGAGGTLEQSSPVAKAAAQGPQSIDVTLAPGQRETIEKDAFDRQRIVGRNAKGEILYSRPMPEPEGRRSTDGGGRRSSFDPPPGDPQSVPLFVAERQKVNQAAGSAQNSRFNNSEIIRLADQAHTGKGAEILQGLGGGYAAIPWTADMATNFNRLGHFIALESANTAAAMGLSGSDAKVGLAQQATIDTGWTKDGIKSAAKVNDALASGLMRFNEGMEKSIRAAGDDVLAIRDFKNKWTNTFDVNVYRYANALERKDQETINEILGKPGTPERAAKAKALAAKSARLYQLTTTGQ